MSIIQWKVKKPNPTFEAYTFFFNFTTRPAFFPVLESVASVATLTARAQSTPTLSYALKSEPKMSSAVVIPVIGTN